MTNRPGTPASTRPAVNWLLVLGLGAVALVRPLARVTGAADVLGAPAGPLLLTGLVTAVWIGVVGLGCVPRPVLTLVLAGLAYGVYVIPLSAVLSTVLTGTLQGPVAVPVAVVPILLGNALWGLVAGLLALGVQRLRGAPR
ncbi:hypothetical protein [Kocuria sp. CH-021]|uniref:Uncharacterized protein n=1 Tax=Kocuria rosea subsp. polaris TaxID=136273 RepID=A0A0W8INQ0_KOCRO|nr:hypothetical protein AVL61_00565 [Kocuria polaris]